MEVVADAHVTTADNRTGVVPRLDIDTMQAFVMLDAVQTPPSLLTHEQDDGLDPPLL